MRSFNVLGPPEVILDSEPVAIGGPQQRRLLCALIESADRTVSVDVLVERLWDDGEQPTGATQAVRSYVARLRRALADDGSLIVTNALGYRLAVPADHVDALLAEQLLHHADSVSTEDPAAAVVVLERAADLWRGEPYGEFAGLDWLAVEIQRLAELRLSVFERLFAAHLAAGSGPDQIGRLERAVVEFPLSERLRGELMMALTYAGRVSDAARAFQSYRTYLAEETGLDPGAELAQLDADIISARIEVPTGRGPMSVTSGSRSTIPVPATSLIGRRDTIDRVHDLLADHRLVTLTGVGGCGKTRLAIEVARQAAEVYTDGAYFADLSLIVDPDEVITAVAEALRLQAGSAELQEQILAYLADKAVLLVLDNCEHLIDSCAAFAAAALRHPGQWRLLATSREYFDIPGEQILQVPSLGANGSSEAIDLFIARAAEVGSGSISESTVPVVAELCQRLDGMPLAIELAAARTVVMSPAELLDRIEQRFRILTGRSRSMVQRQQTLETMLDWSFNLLTDDEQHMLSAMGVIRGPFDLAAAAAVASRDEFDAVDLLQSLIAKSLVERTDHPEGTTYRLLETVRSYAEAILLKTGRLINTRHLALDHALMTSSDFEASVVDYNDYYHFWTRAVARHWVRLRAFLESSIDWAVTAERYDDAARILVTYLPIWRGTRTPYSILDRLEEVRAHLPAGYRREQLWLTEMILLVAAKDVARVLATVKQAASSSHALTRMVADRLAGQIIVETDPQKAAELADRLPPMFKDMALADIRLMAADYDAALRLLMPHRDAAADTADGWLTDARIAAILLMSGDVTAALELIENQPDIDLDSRPFAVLQGLCFLELGHRAKAEAMILDEAHLCASGRVQDGVSAALMGMAALAHDSGHSDWSAEIMMQLGPLHLVAQRAVARWIADRIGILDQYHQRQIDNFGKSSPSAAPILRQVLARWTETTA